MLVFDQLLEANLCVACLATRTSLNEADALAALDRLSSVVTLSSASGICAGCRRVTKVFQIVVGPSP
jgi:hypothetical protein